MKKITLVLLLAGLLVSCKKNDDYDNLGCIKPLPLNSFVEFKEKEVNHPGFNQFKIHVMPLKIREVLGQKCDFVFYLTTDMNGDTVKVYSSSIKRWLSK